MFVVPLTLERKNYDARRFDDHRRFFFFTRKQAALGVPDDPPLRQPDGGRRHFGHEPARAGARECGRPALQFAVSLSCDARFAEIYKPSPLLLVRRSRLRFVLLPWCPLQFLRAGHSTISSRRGRC